MLPHPWCTYGLWLKKMLSVMDQLCPEQRNHRHDRDYDREHHFSHFISFSSALFPALRQWNSLRVWTNADVSQRAVLRALTSSWIPAWIIAYMLLYRRQLWTRTLETREARETHKGGHCYSVRVERPTHTFWVLLVIHLNLGHEKRSAGT